jgi:hypothetical protein
MVFFREQGVSGSSYLLLRSGLRGAVWGCLGLCEAAYVGMCGVASGSVARCGAAWGAWGCVGAVWGCVGMRGTVWGCVRLCGA